MAKRGRKPKNERKGYFYEEQEDAVKEYLTTEDIKRKNEIFDTILKPAFTKMIESIIRKYHLYVPDEEFDVTFSDTMSFLMTKIDHFKPEKNHKAYSYCGTICKNYLLHRLDSFSKQLERTTPYDEVYDEISNNSKFAEETEHNDFVEMLIADTVNSIKTIMNNTDTISLNENELKVGNSLIFLMENWEDIFPFDGSNKFNKSSVLYFLRESTMLTTKELRDSMKKYKKAYYDAKKDIIEREK